MHKLRVTLWRKYGKLNLINSAIFSVKISLLQYNCLNSRLYKEHYISNIFVVKICALLITVPILTTTDHNCSAAYILVLKIQRPVLFHYFSLCCTFPHEHNIPTLLFFIFSFVVFFEQCHCFSSLHSFVSL